MENKKAKLTKDEIIQRYVKILMKTDYEDPLDALIIQNLVDAQTSPSFEYRYFSHMISAAENINLLNAKLIKKYRIYSRDSTFEIDIDSTIQKDANKIKSIIHFGNKIVNQIYKEIFN